MPVTLAEEAEGQEPELNDPITTNGNSQVITAVVVIVVVVVIIAIPCLFYVHHCMCQQRRFRRELRDSQNNDNLQLCEVAPWQVDSSNTSLTLPGASHARAPSHPEDPQPPPSYATVPRPPPYVQRSAARLDVRVERKETA